jgi:hypothetical protein
MERREFYSKLLLIISIALSPIICYLLVGYRSSYSMYFLTEAQPLFIIGNVMTAFYLHKIKDWELPAFTIILVLTFSVDKYPMMHNILAVFFFVQAMFIIYKKGRNVTILIPYVLSLSLAAISLFYAEVAAIIVLCTHHAINLFKFKKVIKKWKQN